MTDASDHPPLISGRGLLAVLAGFLVMAFVSVLATWGVLVVRNGGSEGLALGLNVASSFLAAALGGYVAGTVGRTRPMLDAGGLALVVALMGVSGIVTGSGQEGEPTWYPWTVTGLGVVGALLGGALRLARGVPHSSEQKLQEAFDSMLHQAVQSGSDGSAAPSSEPSQQTGSEPRSRGDD